jgi:4-amino-4-deoxy-L-arabinose transferase-like glycosyltransferase
MKQKIKFFFKNKNLIVHLFLIFSTLIFICASISPIRTLFKNNFMYTIISLIVFCVLIYCIWKFLKRAEVEKKWIEYLIVGILILLGLLLRIGTNNIIKTQPISDFNTPHDVYKQLHSENNDIFAPKSDYQSLSFYQRYYSSYPAWFPYMKVISFIYDTFGENLKYIKLMNWGLYIITSLLLYWIGKKIKSKKAGIIALLLFSCFPSLIVYTNITTPDHFTILLFTCFIATWVKLLEYRKKKSKKIILWCFLNVLSIIGINLFKPLSILGLLVFICTELLCILFPILRERESRKQYFKQSFAFAVGFIIACYLGISISSHILNVQVEKTIHTEVVDSTPLYLLWAYSLDEKGNYNPDIATQTYTELLIKYNGNQKEVMKELAILAKTQIVKNISKLPKIFYQKFKVVFSSEEDIFSFANYSNNEIYEQKLRKTILKYYIYISNTFMGVLFLLCTFSLIKEIKDKEKNPIIIVITLTIIGYFLILLLGGVQGRYKMLMASLLCILAGTIFSENRKEDEYVNKCCHSLL